MVLLQISCFAVNVETTTNLNVYYPDYTQIDLICGQMPKAAQKITGTVLASLRWQAAEPSATDHFSAKALVK